jgi:hypothetical protein
VNANVYENLTLHAEQVSYKSIDEYVQSDHKPVAGEFIIKVFRCYMEGLQFYITLSGKVTWLILVLLCQTTVKMSPGLFCNVPIQNWITILIHFT